MRQRYWSLVILAAVLIAGCGPSEAPPAGANTPTTVHDHATGPPRTLADWAKGATLFSALGTFHRQATTSSVEAQKYFDQGMRLLWAFNHDESTRSFAQAAVLDPMCAICYWGVALTVGPNYNVPIMAAPRAKVAWEALQLARQHASRGTAAEQTLILALSKRYKGPQPLDPSNSGPVLTAYADAMRDAARQFPNDLDIQVLFAEALMNTNPWKLWSNDGKPAAGTPEIQATLERVLAKDPTHPGANHYYVHAMEASRSPERALASAERLSDMMPDAGHLQHMPAHILQRVGRYEDASRANRDGVASDLAYLKKTPPLDYYGMYLAHNYQFLAYSAAMEGRKAEALDAARKMRDTLPVEMLLVMPGVDWYISEIYSTMIRFGEWDALLAEPAPDPRLKVLTGGYHYGRAVAFAAQGRVDEANAAFVQLHRVASDLPPDAGAGLNTATDILAVALRVALGAIARGAGKTDEAIARWREAIVQEDQLAYDEPADWFVPVRHQLGALLLSVGKAAEAEALYREDLARHPHNGWALFGLAQSLRAQGKAGEAAVVDREFAEAWRRADVTLTASAY